MILLKASACWWLPGFSGCLLTNMDEVARGLSLAGHVCLEISVDAVLHFAIEGLIQQSCEALQTVRVVGETEFTGEHKHRRDTVVFVMSNVPENGVDSP